MGRDKTMAFSSLGKGASAYSIEWIVDAYYLSPRTRAAVESLR